MVASLQEISAAHLNLQLENVRRGSMRSRFLRVLLMAGCFGVFSATAYAAQVATTTTLTSNPTSGTAGVPSKFTVTVKGTDGSAVPSGQVAICTNYDEDCNLAEATFVVQLSAAGTASFNWIGVGSYTLVQAGFAGTKSYAASMSPAFTQFPFLVPPNIPTVTILAATGAPGAYTLNATMTTHLQGDGANEAPSAAMQFLDTSAGNSVLGTAVSFGGVSHSLIVPGTPPTVGTQPNYVATGDFNGDGLTDIAVVNSGDNTIGILISNGDGTFKPQVTYSTGGSPGNVPDAILVGDFNADGNVDLAVLNKTDKNVGILLGNGTGTFALQTTTYPTGNNPIALATGDLNEDGVADLVVLNHDDTTVSVLLGNGSGGFASQVTYATGNDPRGIAVGDTNLDGHVDIVVANFADNSLSMLLGNGNGTVTASTPLSTGAGSGPVAVALVDLDDVGYTSLIYLNYTANSMTIMSRQFEDPSYVTTTYQTGVGPVAVAFQNFDRAVETFNPVVLSSDGTLDIYIGSGNYDGVYGPTPTTYSAPVGALSLGVGDFNGDANLDIFTGGGTSAAPELSLQQLTYTFGYTISGISITGISTDNVIASFPGDATYQASASTAVPLTDSQVTTTTSLAINPNHGVNPGGTTTLTATVGPLTSGNFTATGSITFFDGTTPICSGVPIGTGVETCTTGPLSTAQHIFTAAYSGDPYFTASTSPKRLLTVSIQSATTLSLSATQVPVGTPVMASVAVTDVNGPANGGVVNLCESTAAYCTGSALLGTVQLQNTNGSTPGTASATLLLPAGKHNVKAVLQNTVVDAVSASIAQPLTVFPNNDTSTTLTSSGSTGKYTLTAAVTSSPANPTAAGPTVTITDAMDPAFVQTAILGGSGFAANFTSPVSYVSDSANSIIHNTKLVSLRNNGVLDMVYANYNAGTLGVRLGNAGTSGSGNGTFGAVTEYTLDPTVSLSCPTSIASADLNGDGKADVVVADQCTGKIYLFLGNGDGTLPTAPNFIYDIDSTLTSPTQNIGPNSMTTGDFNQDGHPDIAVGTQEGTMYILLNNATGDGSFKPAVLYPGYQGDAFFMDLTAVDLNGDGALDLVYTQLGGDVASVMLGNGDGTFGYEIQNDNIGGDGFSGSGLAVGDFNSDGIPDVVTSGDSGVSVMLGIGDGTFHDGTTIGTGSFSASAVVVGDFNGDGVQDIVVTNGSTTSGIGIITGKSTTQNNPDGSITYLPTGTFNSFAKLGSSFGTFDLEMAAGDVNGDGVLDLVVVGQDTDRNYVLLGTGGFTATASATNVSVPGATATSAHSLIASYPGDGNHNASASTGLAIAGTLIPTTVTLGINPSSGSTYSGSNTAVTATVSTTVVSSYKTTSNVTFKDSTKTLGTAAVSGTSALTSGAPTTAVYNYVPAVGSHSFTGTFVADTNFKASSASASLADTVVQGTPVVTWSPPTQIVPSMTLSGVLTATASTVGVLTYTATLSGGSPVSVTASTVLAYGNYTVTATFVPTDTVDYTSPVVLSEPLSVSENVWVVNSDGGLSELHGGPPASGSEVVPGGTGSAASGGVAFDSAGNVWSVNAAANQLLKATKTGSSPTLLTGGGLNAPAAVAIDGNGTVWVANGSGSVSAFANGGGALSPATTGYSGGGMSSPSGISVDVSGNVWISNSGNNSATEVIGGAAPVAPMSVGLAAGTLGVVP